MAKKALLIVGLLLMIISAVHKASVPAFAAWLTSPIGLFSIVCVVIGARSAVQNETATSDRDTAAEQSQPSTQYEAAAPTLHAEQGQIGDSQQSVHNPIPPSPLLPTLESTDVPAPAIQTIGGWLLLFCVCAVILEPVGMLVTLQQYPLWVSLFFLPLGVLHVGSGLLLWRRNPKGLRWVRRFFLAFFCWSFVLLFLLSLGDPKEIPGQLGSLVWALVWWKYLRESKRVRATFGHNMEGLRWPRIFSRSDKSTTEEQGGSSAQPLSSPDSHELTENAGRVKTPDITEEPSPVFQPIVGAKRMGNLDAEIAAASNSPEKLGHADVQNGIGSPLDIAQVESNEHYAGGSKPIRNFNEGMRRLAIFAGVLGAVAGGAYAFKLLRNVPSERAQHKVFEHLAASDVVKQEQAKLRSLRASGVELGWPITTSPKDDKTVTFNLSETEPYSAADNVRGVPPGLTAEPIRVPKGYTLEYEDSGTPDTPDPYAATAEPIQSTSAPDTSQKQSFDPLAHGAIPVEGLPAGAVLKPMKSRSKHSYQPVNKNRTQVPPGFDTVVQKKSAAKGIEVPEGLTLMDDANAHSGERAVRPDYYAIAKKLGGTQGPSQPASAPVVSASNEVKLDFSRAQPINAAAPAAVDHNAVNSDRIQTIFWKNDLNVDFFEMEDGGSVDSGPSPSAWSYLWAVIFPALGFFILWGAIRGIGWVGAGFLQMPK